MTLGLQVSTHYMNDFLKEEMAHEEMIRQGKIGPDESEHEMEEWEEVRSLFTCVEALCFSFSLFSYSLGEERMTPDDQRGRGRVAALLFAVRFEKKTGAMMETCPS